jgi:hypothetical protein
LFCLLPSWLRHYLNYAKSRTRRCDHGLHRGKVFHGHEQTEIIQGGIGFDFSLVFPLDVRDLSQLSKLIVRRDRPEDLRLSAWSFLQFVEAHCDFRFFTILVWLNENVRARTSHRAREVHF